MSSDNQFIARIGLVGVSGYARIILNLLLEAQERSELEVTATVVINQSEEAELVAYLKSLGVKIYKDYDSFLNEQASNLDLVCLPVGIGLHASMTTAALHAGMNVLVEKPLAGSLAQAEKIIRAEKISGKFVAVGFQDMYLKKTQSLKHEILNGLIGEIKEVRFLGLWPRSKAYYQRNEWAGRISVDGNPIRDSPLQNAFGHFVLMSLFLAGDTFDSSAEVNLTEIDLRRAHNIDSFDTALVRAESKDNIVQFWFGVSHVTREDYQPRINIEGSNGSIEWVFDNYCVLNQPGKPALKWNMPTTWDARRCMIKSVILRLQDPAQFLASPSNTRSHTALIESIHEYGEIRNFDAELIQSTNINGDVKSEVPAVVGLERMMKSAYVRRSLLGESRLNKGHLKKKL